MIAVSIMSAMKVMKEKSMINRAMKIFIVALIPVLFWDTAGFGQNVKVYHMARDKNIEQGMRALSVEDFQSASYFLWKAARSNQAKARKVSIYNNICAVDFVLEKYKRALKACNAALTLDKRNWRALLNRGSVYRNIGKFELAKQDYHAVRKIRPDEAMLVKAQQILAKYEGLQQSSGLVAVNGN